MLDFEKELSRFRPSLEVGDVEAAIVAMKEELAGSGIYTIGRYGGWTYCSMEDCMLEATALARTLQNDAPSNL